MINLAIALLDLFAASFFMMAAIWGFFNFKEEVAVTSFWITYLCAAVSGTIFMLLRALEWGGIKPLLLDELQPFFGIVSITLLAANATICALSSMKHQVK